MTDVAAVAVAAAELLSEVRAQLAESKGREQAWIDRCDTLTDLLAEAREALEVGVTAMAAFGWECKSERAVLARLNNQEEHGG